jgi:galactokinase/mevalonate kinase-like predicted kinase
LEFGELLDTAWKEKKKLSKFISSEKLDELYEECKKNGAIAGKLMGAGGGGYMLLLCSDITKCTDYLVSRSYNPERVQFDWDGLVVGDL